jgi:hypothetical protein
VPNVGVVIDVVNGGGDVELAHRERGGIVARASARVAASIRMSGSGWRKRCKISL